MSSTDEGDRHIVSFRARFDEAWLAEAGFPAGNGIGANTPISQMSST